MKPRQTTILGLALLLGGLMLCGFGLWLLFSPPQYRATVRIKFEPDVLDISGMIRYHVLAGFDPYFVQATFEIIDSQYVLGNVVTNLNLNEVWGEKYGDGNPLKTSGAIKTLDRHLHLEAVRNAKLIDISYTSDNPKEAAQIANAIAEGYKNYRLATWRERTAAGIKILKQQYDLVEKQIQMLQTNVDELHKNIDISGVTNALFSPMRTIGENPMPLYQRKIEDEFDYVKSSNQLNSLKAYSTEQLRDVLPTVYPDAILSGLLDKYNESKNESFVISENYLTPANKEAVAKRIKSSTDALEKQIDARVLGLMAGITSMVASEKAALDAINKEIDDEKVKDLANTKNNQLYYDAKLQLDQMIGQNRLLRLKIEAVKKDASIPKNAMMQVITAAAPPTAPISQNFMLAISLIIVGLFPVVAGLLLLKSSRQPIG